MMQEIKEFNNTTLGTLEKQDYIIRVKSEDGEYFNTVYFYEGIDEHDDTSHYESSRWFDEDTEYYVLGYIPLESIDLALMAIIDTKKWRELL